MSDILAKLAAPFPPERISWRVGPTNKEKTKGIALAYIDARAAQPAAPITARERAALESLDPQGEFAATVKS